VNLVQGRGIIGGLSLLPLLQRVHCSRTPTMLHRLLCTLMACSRSSGSRMLIILPPSAHGVIGWTRTVRAHHLRKKSRPIQKEMGIYAHAPAKGWCADHHHLQTILIRCRWMVMHAPQTSGEIDLISHPSHHRIGSSCNAQTQPTTVRLVSGSRQGG